MPYTVIWQRRRVSALPVRLRLLNEASPLAYSLDIRRQLAYGDSWTAVSLGRPDRDEDRNPAQIGINQPLQAQYIARGGVPTSGQNPKPATTPLEAAARQVAIWASTNGLPLDAASVPNPDLRRRARQLQPPEKFSVPLQSANHAVAIFVRETTANTVRLAVTIDVDANTSLSTAQDIDLYLDGVRCPIRTHATTAIDLGEDNQCHAEPPTPLEHGVNGVAEVEMDRNTKVVDASAIWVGVRTDPGLFLVSGGTAPPVITAETVTLNYRSTTRLDPNDYTGPRELLDQAGTGLLAKIPTGWVWPVLLLALYLLPRAGRAVDALLTRAAGQLRRQQPAPDGPPTTISAEAVIVTAPTVADAVAAAQAATGGDTHLDIEVLERPRRHLLAPDQPAKVRVIRHVG